MGHNIKYKGVLYFDDPAHELDKFLEEDIRDHEDWIIPEGFDGYFIDWEKQDNALVHNGAEKSYDGANQLRTILLNTKAVHIEGVIRSVSDYGKVTVINCIGREVEEKVLVEG